MRVGDLLEWIVAGLLVAAGYLGTHMIWVALLIGGICLAYFAQNYAMMELPKIKAPRIHISRPHFTTAEYRAHVRISASLWWSMHGIRLKSLRTTRELIEDADAEE